MVGISVWSIVSLVLDELSAGGFVSLLAAVPVVVLSCLRRVDGVEEAELAVFLPE